MVVRPGSVHIGRNCVVMNGCLMMAAGGITIEDGPHGASVDEQLDPGSSC